MQGVSKEISDRLADHIRNDTTDMAPSDLIVPAANFSDPVHAEREFALMRAQYLIITHMAELPNPGSFITRDVLGTPVLVTRKRDGKVAAFRNMCRHRGGKVELEESGRKPFFVCSYHGWSYESSGKLRGVPFQESFELKDRECRNLHAIDCEERHGFIWIRIDGRSEESVADFLGEETDAHFPVFELEKKGVYRTETVEVDVNWKLIMDGASDILHPQFLHANGVGKLLTSNISAFHELGRNGQSYSPRRRLLDAVKASEDYDLDWRYFGANMFVWPNSMVLPTPDHIEFWTVWPLSVDRSRIHIRFLIEQERMTERVTSRIDKSWEILKQAALEEDFPMEETIQRNAAANPQEPFLYGRSELSIQRLHQVLEKELANFDG